jgi:hypothetical protein
MATGNKQGSHNRIATTPKPYRYFYKLNTVLESYSVYEIMAGTEQKLLLTEILRIEKFREKSQSKNIANYLRLRTTTNWETCELITGLRPTSKRGLFYGDWLKTNILGSTAKHLLIFQFAEGRDFMFIDVYRGFYPTNRKALQKIISTYPTN